MLSGLKNAEKTPDKGWKVYPKFDTIQEVSEEEDEDEVMLLDDNCEKSSKAGGTKRCLSNQFKEPQEYVRKAFKIPKKSPENDHHDNYSNSNQDKRNCSLPSQDNHRNTRRTWGLESSFDEGNVTMRTRLTRNSCLRNRGTSVSKRNVRQMVQRQDFSLINEIKQVEGRREIVTGKRQSPRINRNAHNSRGNVEKNSGPFNDEINMVIEKNQNHRNFNDNKNVSKNNVAGSKVTKEKVPSIRIDSKNATHSTQDDLSKESSDNPLNKGLTDGESSSEEDDGEQYFKDLYKEKLLDISSPPEKDTEKKCKTESKAFNCEKNSTPKPNCQESSKKINFPSSAATSRHSIHECSTSDDEKTSTSNTESFYGPRSKSNVVKVYGNKTSRKLKDKVEWTDDDDKDIVISTSDVDDSPVPNTKKRKANLHVNKKNAKKDDKNKNSSTEKQRKKHKAEPDFYLISSSDEEDNESGLGDCNVSGTESVVPKINPVRASTTPSSKTTAAKNTAVNGQDPSLCKMTGAVDNPFERDSFTTEIMLGPKVMLGKLLGSTNGILEINALQLKWRMKYIDNNDKSMEQVVLILASDLTSFKIHVDNDPKIIVLEVNQRCALKLRGKFNLGKFVDPESAVVEETEIILQVDDNLSAETIADIQEWVQDRLGKSYKDLSSTEAGKLNERLNSSSDTASKSVDTKKATHYNTRSSVIRTTSRTTITPTKMIIYPPPPTHGGITVTSADVECLAEGQFLNDVIIDFYLKYIYHDILSEEDKKRTHIFSSFFYKRLTQRSSSNNDEFFQSPHDRMHNQVKKWTRHVDIFSKDYIIVPINESSHWYLAIICFPHLEEPIIEKSPDETETETESEDNIVEDSTDSEAKDKETKDKVENDADEKNDDADDEDDADLEMSALAVGAKKATPSKQPKSKNKPVIKARPCILIFDSLGSGGRARVFKNLKNYLCSEWKAKRPDQPAREFSSESFKGAFPKVPEQDNHCDCGIFVLQYVESFFEDPIQNYNFTIHKEHWFTHDGISGKRQEIKDLILRLRDKYNTSSS